MSYLKIIQPGVAMPNSTGHGAPQLIRCIAVHISACAIQIRYVLARSVSASPMAWAPPFHIDAVPNGEALRPARFKYLTCAIMCWTIGIPQIESGSPRPGVVVFKVSSGIYRETDYSDVSDEERVV